MADTSSVNTDGFGELTRALSDLPQEVGKKILGSSLKAGGEIIRSAITVRTPKRPTGTGNLRRSITLRQPGRAGYTGSWFATTRGAGIQFNIGPEYSRAKKGYHGHLVEYGTKRHDIVAGMKYTTTKSGRIKYKPTKTQFLVFKKDGRWWRAKKVSVSARPHPFLRPGFDASKNSAINTIHNRLSRDIESTFERMTK